MTIVISDAYYSNDNDDNHSDDNDNDNDNDNNVHGKCCINWNIFWQ